MTNLIFLHGLLGTKSDWQKLIEKLPHFRCFALDLPYHGNEKHSAVHNFSDCDQFLAKKITSLIGEQPYYLVGYSLGGRLALHYSLAGKQLPPNLQGVILEGANLGLATEKERQQRWQQDQNWAARFMQEPPQIVLEDWYQQPVFSHLTALQRKALIAQRSSNCGANIGKMLLATSLAKQPNFAAKVRSNSELFFYVCGARDQKFQAMASENHLKPHLIPNAGHNAHLENPSHFAQWLNSVVGY